MAKHFDNGEDEKLYIVVKNKSDDEAMEIRWNLSLMLEKMILGLLIVASHIIWQ